MTRAVLLMVWLTACSSPPATSPAEAEPSVAPEPPPIVAPPSVAPTEPAPALEPIPVEAAPPSAPPVATDAAWVEPVTALRDDFCRRGGVVVPAGSVSDCSMVHVDVRAPLRSLPGMDARMVYVGIITPERGYDSELHLLAQGEGTASWSARVEAMYRPPTDPLDDINYSSFEIRDLVPGGLPEVYVTPMRRDVTRDESSDVEDATTEEWVIVCSADSGAFRCIRLSTRRDRSHATDAELRRMDSPPDLDPIEHRGYWQRVELSDETIALSVMADATHWPGADEGRVGSFTVQSLLDESALAWP